MRMTKEQHLDPDFGPKRILSLDGGGIRGVLTLEFLEVIERKLRDRYKDEALTLSDYFDLIGGCHVAPNCENARVHARCCS